MKSKQTGLDAKFRTNKTIAEKKLEIEKQLSVHHENLKSNKKSMNEHLLKLKTRENDILTEVFDLQVEYDNSGNVKSVYKLQKVN